MFLIIVIILSGLFTLIGQDSAFAARHGDNGLPEGDKNFRTTAVSPVSLSDTALSDTLVFHVQEVQVIAFNRPQRLMDVPGSITHLGNVTLERMQPA